MTTFDVKLSNGTVIPATAVENYYRRDYNATPGLALSIQLTSSTDVDNLDDYMKVFTPETMSHVEVTNGKTVLKFDGYTVIRNMSKRITSTGVECNFIFAKPEDIAAS